MSLRRSVLWLSLIALTVAPAVLAARFIALYSTTVPAGEEWFLIDMVSRLFDGTLTISDIFAQVNEHRIATTMVAYLVIGLADGLDPRGLVYLSAVLYGAAWAAILLALRRRMDWVSALAWSAPAAWILFSPRQLDNFMFGMQVCMAFATVASIWALILIARSPPKWRPAGAAIALAIVASYSFATGLMTWPAGALVLLGRAVAEDGRMRRAYARSLILWCIAAALTLTAWFAGWARPAKDPALADVEPISLARFVATALGAPLTWNVDLALAAGCVLTAVYLAIVVRILRAGRRAADTSWAALGLIAFVVLAAVMIGHGRAVLGFLGPTVPRYSTIAGLGLAAVFLALSDAAVRGRRLGTMLAAGGAAVLVVALVDVHRQAESYGLHWAALFGRLHGKLVSYRVQPPEELAAIGPAYLIEKLAPFLERKGYSVFKQ
jgi:hypothetical protein